MRDLIIKLLKESLINEKSLSDVSTSEFNFKEIMDHWLSVTPSSVIHEYKYEMQGNYYLSPEEVDEIMNMDEEDIMETEDFKSWLVDHVEFKIDEVISNISGKIVDGRITVWREMTVSNEWISKLPTTGMRLGKYWTFDEGSAEAYWGAKNDNTITFQTTIDEKYIDWHQTIMANIDPALGEDEKEITLFKNTPIYIDRIHLNDKDMDISNIKSKKFKV